MRFRSVPNLTLDTLRQLIEAGLRESRTLDFKRDAVGTADSDKREFAADVSAFANTGGGHLLFGVEESEGVATALVGIKLDDPDAEFQRLGSVLLTGLEPRLPGVEFDWFPMNDGRGVLALHVQQSWAAPHRVTATRHFYRRNSAGKYSMDVQELRAAFGEHDRALTAMREFRTQRAVALYDQSNALPTEEGPRLLVHVVPLSSYYELRDFSDRDESVWLPPLEHHGGWNRRYILEGFATTHYEDEAGRTNSYTLLTRSGIIEGVAVAGRIEEQGPQQGTWVFLDEVQRLALQGASRYLNTLIQLDVPPPWFVFVSLVGVEGARHYRRHVFPSRGFPQFRNTYAFLPEVVIGSIEEAVPQTFSRVIEQLWNAFGLPAPD